MLVVFNQRSDLGLVRCHGNKDIRPKLKSVSDEKPLYIILMSDHDPESQVFARELQLVPREELPFEIMIASANMMGYGLYNHSIRPFFEFLEDGA